MIFRNNQYIKLRVPIIEISKIRVIIDEENGLLNGEEGNIAIAYNIDYENIIKTVKILITNEGTLKMNKYKIGENIESIIIEGYIIEKINKEEIERLMNTIEIISECEKLDEMMNCGCGDGVDYDKIIEIYDNKNINKEYMKYVSKERQGYEEWCERMIGDIRSGWIR